MNSVVDDIIYSTTRGRVKPGKHLTSGLGLKSLTGSRQVIDIVKRLGHCISYHQVEAIETELATQTSNNNCYTPDGILPEAGLCTELAWDNFNEFVDKLSSKKVINGFWRGKIVVLREFKT